VEEEDEKRTLVGRDTKTLVLHEAKATSVKDPGGFEGYGAVFGNVDSWGDIIMPGAFKETIDQFLTNGFSAIGHKWSDLPVATFDVAKEDSKGLWVEGTFHSDDFSQRARKILAERLDRGKTVGLSIGFDIPQGGSSWATGPNDEFTGIRLLHKINLLEVSLVNAPANDQALASNVKNRVCDDIKCGCRLGVPHHGGLKFADHGEALLNELRGYLLRAKSHADLRAKDGRAPSEDQAERLTAIMGEMKTLLDTFEGMCQGEVEIKSDVVDASSEVVRATILRAQQLVGA
jgi:HK97 family phage prohead protease